MVDTPDIFRENILEIIDNWAGYPVQNGCLPNSAKNAGTVEIRCFVNNSCPFAESSLEENTIVFNESTFNRIKKTLPDGYTNILTTTPGVEGIHFIPKYIYRSNYIYSKIPEDELLIDDPFHVPSEDIYSSSDFDTYFKEIEVSSLNTSDVTRYKEEQSWVIVPSVFDNNASDIDIETPECGVSAQWVYDVKEVTKSAATKIDLLYDFNEDIYNEELANLDGIFAEGKSNLISKYRVQIPVQKKIRKTNGENVSWRLAKRTPLFYGEDFFVTFYRLAEVGTVDQTRVKIPSFTDDFYAPLDVTASGDVRIAGDEYGSFYRPINLAVRPPVSGKDKDGKKIEPDFKTFDFYSQPYYIIELGYGSLTEHYFIIITQSSHPVFVNFVYGDMANFFSKDISNNKVSKIFSVFEEINGEQLIRAKEFRMTVRNHLGSLVIQFEGDGIKVPPWIIKRVDWNIEWNSNSGQAEFIDKINPIVVPRGHMFLWGGNLRSGFNFGPLQYKGGYMSMTYPPKEVSSQDEEWSMLAAFDDSPPTEIPSENMKGSFQSNPFFLPTDGNHHVLFHAADVFIEGLDKGVVEVGKSKQQQKLFTQDAQFYKEYIEKDFEPIKSEYTYGGFFYGNTIREFPDYSIKEEFDWGGDTNIHYKTSNIAVKKYRYLNDPKTKKTAFDILIGMMAGDHIFTNAYWGVTPDSDKSKNKEFRPSWDVENNNNNTLNDDIWYLPDCKTPIISSIRLIAEEADTIRWDDGTTPSSGVAFTPFENPNNPYYVDVTDHVMNFSDSWSATGFSEMEHTGSLNFLLDRSMIVEKNNTDYLLSLQNKTFYVDIWAGYSPCSYTNVTGFYKMFTGLCHGGSIEYKYNNKNIMSCKVLDYTEILKGFRFFNSPFFDGMKDIKAIDKIMQLSGFRSRGKYDPGSLIRNLSDSADNLNSSVYFHHFDGRMFKSEVYALPSAYDRLEQPGFKFDDGSPLIEAIEKISKRAGKVFYFDELGIAHYEDMQDFVRKEYQGQVRMAPLYQFTTNPEIAGGQIVFNKVDRAYEVSGIINHIKIMSNTPDMHLLIRDDTNRESLYNPESEGFLGYLKSMYQQEGMFGSKEAVLDTVRRYKVMFRPKVNVKFETYGVPLRSNDIISLNEEVLRVMKVSHTIEAETNRWWMNVECMRYQPVQSPTS